MLNSLQLPSLGQMLNILVGVVLTVLSYEAKLMTLSVYVWAILAGVLMLSVVNGENVQPDALEVGTRWMASSAYCTVACPPHLPSHILPLLISLR